MSKRSLVREKKARAKDRSVFVIGVVILAVVWVLSIMIKAEITKWASKYDQFQGLVQEGNFLLLAICASLIALLYSIKTGRMWVLATIEGSMGICVIGLAINSITWLIAGVSLLIICSIGFAVLSLK